MYKYDVLHVITSTNICECGRYNGEGSGYRILITKLFRASKVEDNKLFNTIKKLFEFDNVILVNK